MDNKQKNTKIFNQASETLREINEKGLDGDLDNFIFIGVLETKEGKASAVVSTGGNEDGFKQSLRFLADSVSAFKNAFYDAAIDIIGDSNPMLKTVLELYRDRFVLPTSDDCNCEECINRRNLIAKRNASNPNIN